MATSCTKDSGRMAKHMAKALFTMQTAKNIKASAGMAIDMDKAPIFMLTGVVTMACGRITLDMVKVSYTQLTGKNMKASGMMA